MFRTSNPALKEEAFKPAQTWDSFMGRPGGGPGNDVVAAEPKVMTLQGTVNASFILLCLTGLGAILGFMFLQANPNLLYITAFGSSVVAFIAGYYLIALKPRLAPYLAPVFSVLLGVFATAASIMWAGYAASGKNAGSMVGQTIILQAGVLTLGIAAAMLIAYTTRLIRPSQTLLAGIVAATGGVFFFGLACVVINFFYPAVIQSMWESPIGLAIAAVIVVIAAANLVLDFAIIESGVENRSPKYMEWFAAFGLVLTLVWLYTSILRLLALLSQRD
jgi:uncharacterized YccA/Bax inhibitor family protein